jgi:O-antigen/teichoic acid export membrane protein
MRNKLKQLFSDSASFAIATMGNKMVAFLLLPIMTRHLRAAQYGDWDLTNTLTLVVTYLSVLGMDAALAFYYFDAKDEQEKRSYFTATVLFSSGICVLFLLVTLLFGDPLSRLLYNKPYADVMAIAIAATVGAIVIQHTLALARYNRRVWLFNIMSMSYVIGSNLLSVIFLIYGQGGVRGIFFGQLVGQIAVAAILVFLFRREFTWRVKKKHLLDLLRYGAPLLPTMLAFWVMNAMSRPMIYHMVSESEAGIYGVAFRFATMVALVTSAFQLAWRPFAMSIKEREDAPRIYSFVARAFLVVGAFFILGLEFIIQPLIQWTTGKPEYWSAYPYVWMLSFGTVLNTLHLIVGVGLLIQKKTSTISQVFIMAAILYFIGNFILVPLYGNWGTAAMTVVTYLFVVLLIYRKSQQVYPVAFRMPSMLAFLAVYLVTMIGITWIQVNDWPDKWVYYVVATLINIAAVFITGVFRLRSLPVLFRMVPKIGQKR